MLSNRENRIQFNLTNVNWLPSLCKGKRLHVHLLKVVDLVGGNRSSYLGMF